MNDNRVPHVPTAIRCTDPNCPVHMDGVPHAHPSTEAQTRSIADLITKQVVEQANTAEAERAPAPGDTVRETRAFLLPHEVFAVLGVLDMAFADPTHPSHIDPVVMAAMRSARAKIYLLVPVEIRESPLFKLFERINQMGS